MRGISSRPVNRNAALTKPAWGLTTVLCALSAILQYLNKRKKRVIHCIVPMNPDINEYNGRDSSLSVYSMMEILPILHTVTFSIFPSLSFFLFPFSHLLAHLMNTIKPDQIIELEPSLIRVSYKILHCRSEIITCSTGSLRATS